ncbi:MAG: nucleotidyltransferase domain-containing protein [Candidatus Aenigmatarchaeota archaeon]
MEHISYRDYKFEIVLELLKNQSHIRALAKDIGTNHMTILRKIKELSDDNVIDYKQEGKNKTYFLKKSIEARNYVMMAENYKLLQLLTKYPQLRKIVDAIHENKHIKLAILFGSYAKAIAKKDSDIDVYIDTNGKKLKNELERTDSRISVKLGNYDRKSPLGKEIEKNHVILKGMEDYYEKLGIFS